MSKDYYAILGLQKGASDDEIKKAYRKKSKEWHPDKHKGEKGAEEKFKEINEAYEVLSDPKKKQTYDQFGTTGGPGAGGFGGFDFSGFQGGQGYSDLGDIFENFFGGGGGRRQGGRSSNRGEDFEIEIVIDLADAVSGVQKTLSLERMTSCRTCDAKGYEKGSSMKSCEECGGTGQVVRTQQSFFGVIKQSIVCPTCQGAGESPEKACPTCSGEGRTLSHDEVAIEIPAGIDDGQTLRIREQGNAGRRGAAPGDLFVHVRVRVDKQFDRQGDDIHTVKHVSVLNAILGADITVETVQGPVQLKVPEGTQSGQILRIKGKGMPVVGSSRHGNHYTEVIVDIPKKLSKKERKLLEEWQKLSS